MSDGTLLPIVRTVADLRDQVAEWRAAGLTVGFVPTMGALHEGHLTLVRTGLECVDRIVASVFVNPTQFGPTEDFSIYPRQEAQDAALLQSAGASLLYAPSVSEMYPAGHQTIVSVGGLSTGLCGDIRPGHFNGVATVVTKLLLQALADAAFFGEKDYQQLQVIRQLVRDLDIPVQVIGVPTVRESDGLAMSSRNAYLTAEQRDIAPILFRILSAAALTLQAGAPIKMILAAVSDELIHAGFDSVDYVSLRDATTLEPLERLNRPGRLLAAARLGKTRLIDNIAVHTP